MSIGRIELLDEKKRYVRYATMGGSGGGGIGAQVGNVKDLTMQRGSGSLTLCWKDPDDMVFNGQKIAEWAGTKVVKKEGGAPQSIEDGALIADSIVKNQYETEGLQDSDVVDGMVYNYALFPYTSENVYTLSDINRISGETYKGTVYGFVIDQSKSDPSEMITYIETNANYTPAKMDFTAGKFDYGDWKDAFFMKFRPCILNDDGTIKFYLNPDNYKQREDGVSFAPNIDDEGNVMIEFPKVYWKIKPISEDVAEVYISDVKQDDEYVCWSHMDVDGNEIPYCYFSAYETLVYDGKTRSVSGKAPGNNSPNNFYNGVKANNPDGVNIWNIMSNSDHTLLMLLSLLIGKSTDAQAVFGYGQCRSYVSNYNYGIAYSGNADPRGVFYGSSSGVVKIFGIENLYGNCYKIYSGIVYDHTKGVSVKMHDDGKDSVFGGVVPGGEQYELIPDSIIFGDTNKCVRKMLFTKQGFFVKELNGTDTNTFYTDSCSYHTTYRRTPLYGGSTNSKNYAGLFNGEFSIYSLSSSNKTYSAFIVCRPMAK